MQTDVFVYLLSIFVMAVFVGYYVVWSVTPALHTPLMSVTNAISSVIIVGAILAIGAGREMPVVKDGVITVATVMTATLSGDHRVIDGAVGAEWMAAFKTYVENPVLALI